MLVKIPALKKIEDLNKYVLEHIWNEEKKSTSVTTGLHTSHWFRNIFAHHIFYTWTSLIFSVLKKNNNVIIYKNKCHI